MVINRKGLFFIFGNFSKALELGIFFFDISIASAIVFPTTFICSFGKPSFLSVFLYNSTGAAKSQVDASIHLVSNCSG
jgi:hypothetical protein